MPIHNRDSALEALESMVEARQRRRQAADNTQEPREFEVVVRVEMSDEAEKFIQVANVKVNELGI